MKYLYFPRMRFYLTPAKTNQKGAITLLALFLFFVFSALGMGMFYVSRIYSAVSAYKKNMIRLEYASENGIKQEFNHLIQKLNETAMPLVLSETEMENLKANTLLKGTKLIETLLGPEISLPNTWSWERMKWECRTDWALENIEMMEDFLNTSYGAEIISLGKLTNFKPKKESFLHVSLDLYLGYLPLAKIPLLIDRKLPLDQKVNFLETNPIELIPSADNRLPPQISFSDANLIPQETKEQIERALKIKIFEPQSLSIPLLRQALGLEISDDPVPEGVYLIQDDLGLGGVFVQGDCEKIILAIEEDFQVISFTKNNGLWILKFCPIQSKTQFITPEETRLYDRIPLGIIIVNGNIHSLGGGFVDLSGEIASCGDEEIPCVLSGVNLSILSSDKIVLSSHLIHQGVDWKDGIPYVKHPKSMLNIYASGKGFLDGLEKEGQIVIAPDSPQEIKIQAELIAANMGIAVEGEDKTVHILGSLQATDYNANFNKLKIYSNDHSLFKDEWFDVAPKSTKPLMTISKLTILGWYENK